MKTITVRMPIELHARLMEAAKIQNVSMNKFCVENLEKASDATIPEKSFERYVGTYVITKRAVPSDRRGEWIKAGERLQVEAVHGKHFDLVWPGTRARAASQVFFNDLKTG